VGSKKFRGVPCVYCAMRVATSADHVFAREFFTLSERSALPKVPACAVCNSQKSVLEHYLTTVLPLGGRHDSASEMLSSYVPRRLSKNLPLHRQLYDGRISVASTANGASEQALAFPIEHTKLEEYFALIAKGLAWYHWKVLLGNDDVIQVTFLTHAGERYFEKNLLNVSAFQVVRGELGGRTITYEGRQGFGCPQVTVWRIEMYGGLEVIADATSLSTKARSIGILTGPRSS
jgi:hypothetical protein